MEEKQRVDKRKYVRLNLETRVRVEPARRKKKAELARKVEGITKNISVEGICFTSESKFKPGTKITVEVFLPEERKSVHLKGEVRWINSIPQEEGKETFDTGVKLYTIDKKDENRFIEFVCDKMTERLSRYLHL